MGTDEATDILAVGFSACDAIGHTYGPDSQEQMDNLLRLDRTLGRLLDEAERRAGKGRVLVVLTADHGVMPLVEVLRAKGIDARRASTEELTGPVDKALAARFPGATSLITDPDPMEYVLDREAIARQGLKVEDVEGTIREALLSTGLIDAVYTQAQLVGPRRRRPLLRPAPAGLLRPAQRRPDRARQEVRLHAAATSAERATGRRTITTATCRSCSSGRGSRRPRDVETGTEDIAWTLGRLLDLPYPQQDAVTDLLPLLR